MADRCGMGRLLARATVVVVALALPASASAATRMYVSTARAADGSATVGGYALDGTTQITDDFQLDLVRGGVTVATAAAPDFVALAPASLEPGDQLVLTDTTTAETHTATFTGNPTLVAPSCGAAAFSGARDAGSTVDVSASLGADSVPTVQRFGPGTTYDGAFSKPLGLGWTVRASQGRVVDAAFTVFDAVSAVVGGTCPVVKQTAPAPVVADPAPVPVAPAAPVVAPAPVVVPADTVAPVGRATLRTQAAAAYRALLAGSFAVTVTIDGPGTVTQTLAVGKTVLGTASARATKAGAVVLKVKLSKNGRRRLVTARSLQLTLTTRLRDAAGNARTLAPSHFTAKRTAR